MRQGRKRSRALSIDTRGAVRAGVLLALVCAACVAGAVALVVGLRADREAKAIDVATEPQASRPVESPALTAMESPPRAPVETSASTSAPPREPRVHEGRGIIRGEITVAAGLSIPAQWKLSIFPSAALHGAERADTRTIEFTHGETSFAVDDLPLGGYGVRADAAGLNCTTVTVVLVPGSENQSAVLVMSRAGHVQGSVLDENDRPAEAVPVTLESRATKARRTQQTDAAGGYRFEDVIDGEYTLYVGRPEAPLLSPDSLLARAPSLTVPDRKLPATGTAQVRTRDENGKPLADAAISGFSAHAGVIDARSDTGGSAIVRYLPEGRYRLHARLEDGRSGSAVAHITAGPTTVVEILLEP